MKRYYILQEGVPFAVPGVEAWGAWISDVANARCCVLRLTSFGDIDISTVFLGIDESPDDGPPLVWETKVFGGPLNSESERYATREQACEGHDRMSERVANFGADIPGAWLIGMLADLGIGPDENTIIKEHDP